ncbi:MAG: type II secretion system GspH family protein [Puniceicoccales bacterium]|jgi:prepilin-type N-terminal cleavage/methylation domain-containing protein|nr:type II secretion system GspH family protein [Puniceicoccales bacterium]
MNYGEGFAKKRGFSLLEMVLVIGLSGVILAAVMALTLTFANVYLSSPSFEAKIERDVFAKKLIKKFLTEYGSAETETQAEVDAAGNIEKGKHDDIDDELFSSGILWQTDDVPIFIGENRGGIFTLGLVMGTSQFKLIWKSEDDVEFKHLVLFDDVRKVSIFSYDGEYDSWSEHEFSDGVVCKVLKDYAVCCLGIFHHEEAAIIPLF